MFSYMKRGSGFYKEVAVLAAPIVMQNLITSTLSMADTFMVGLMGEAPMAAVTLANIPIRAVNMFIFGAQSGSSILISQYWGKQDRRSISRVMGAAMWTVLAVTALFALIMNLWPLEFLSLFGNEQSVIATAAQYGDLAALSCCFNGLTMMYIAAYRSMEKPQLGMYILIASMSLNTFLNWVFIFGHLGSPVMGVRGAALATLIARIFEVCAITVHMLVTRFFRVDFAALFRPGREMLRRFFLYGGPVVLNETMWGLGTSVMPTIMGHMAISADMLAAYAIMGNIDEEYDDVAPEIEAIGPDEYLLDGGLLIDDLNEELELSIESEDCDTISGYLIEQLGHIPQEGARERITIDNLAFLTEDVRDNRIASVRMKILPQISNDE